MYVQVNMTPRECLNMYGTLPTAMTERLVEESRQLEEAKECAPCIREAKGQYPAEDFLQKQIKELYALAKNLRGENKNALELIAIALEEIQSDVRGSSEYGRDELNKALDGMGAQR